MKLGVALAGGAFKGICHLGALEVLEKNGIKIDMVSGCSMGAVVGGLYAAGVPVEKLKGDKEVAGAFLCAGIFTISVPSAR